MNKMYQRFFTSVSFLISFFTLSFYLYLLVHFKDGELYGINNNTGWQKILIFNLKETGAIHYLSSIISFFYHYNFSHLLTNLFVLIILGFLIEKKLGRIKFLSLILAGHFITLLTLKTQYYYLNLTQDYSYSGLSAGLLTLAIFYLGQKKKWFTIFFVASFFSYQYIQSAGPLIEPHLLAIIIGCLLYFCNRVMRNKSININ